MKTCVPFSKLLMVILLPMLLLSCGAKGQLPYTSSLQDAALGKVRGSSSLSLQPRLGLGVDVVPNSLFRQAVGDGAQSGSGLSLLPRLGIGVDLTRQRSMSAADHNHSRFPQDLPAAIPSTSRVEAQGDQMMVNAVQAEVMQDGQGGQCESCNDVKVMPVIELANGVKLQKVVTVARSGSDGPVFLNVSTYNVSKADTLDVLSDYAVTNKNGVPLNCCGKGSGLGGNKIIYNAVGNTATGGGDAGDIDAATIVGKGNISN